uniref:Uncharacterized protein n=1 Tax=Arundo donax TaxID=35708 RepID=A0A0A9AWF6_ARUDO
MDICYIVRTVLFLILVRKYVSGHFIYF